MKSLTKRMSGGGKAQPSGGMGDELAQLRDRITALEALLHRTDRLALGQAKELEIALEQHAHRTVALADSEQRLLQQTMLLQSVLASLSDGVVAVDAQGHFVLFNPAAERLVGLGPVDVTPAQWSERYSLFLADGVTPHPSGELPLVRAMHGESVDAQTVFVKRTDSRRGAWLSVSARPVLDSGGTVTGAVAVFHDITGERLATERLQRFALQLERSNRDLEDFASVTSHDLQEPLRKIEAFAQLLLQDFGETFAPEAREYVDRMRGSARRLQSLIGDLLRFSRISKEGDQFAPVDLTQIVRDVVGDLDMRVKQVGATIELGDLPVLDADPTQIYLLFQNLIGNALKFHRPGKAPRIRVHGRVLVAPASAGESTSLAGLCEVAVEDNGIGFPPEQQERMFSIFQRLHNRAQYEGSGIGLAICRRIAERHGGTIAAHGHPGEGATFVVTLPLRHPSF